MVEIVIVGEDDVTREIIKRIINEYTGGMVKIIQEMPARGGEIKGRINMYNTLASSYPVIILLDLDANNCPPELINSLGIENKQSNLILNVAIDEAEAWLMADRIGFAKYIGVDESEIPQSKSTKLNGNKYTIEMDFPAKSSMCLTKVIVPKSKNSDIKKKMTPNGNACKGKEYNSAILPFIREVWDIEAALANSDSLKRMVNKIKGIIC